MSKISKIICLVPVVMFFSSYSTNAEPIQASVRIAPEYSDNALKTATGAKSEWRIRSKLGLKYKSDGSVVDTNINLGLISNQYLKNTYDDETYVIGSANIDLIILPSRLSWLFHSTHDRGLSSDYLTDTPDNRVNRSIYKTGPVINLKLSDVDSARLGLSRVFTVFDQETSKDNTRDIANMNWFHGLNSTTRLESDLEYLDVKFDNGGLDYEQVRVGFGVAGSWLKGNYKVKGGLARLRYSDGSKGEGPFYELSLDYQEAGYVADLSAVRRLTDTTVGLTVDDGKPGSGDSNFGAAKVVWRTRVQSGLQLVMDSERSTLSFLVYFDEENPIQGVQKIKKLGGEIGFNYNFSERTLGKLSFDGRKTRFVDQEDELLSKLGVELNHNLTRDLSMDVNSKYHWKTSKDQSREYNEWRLGGGISYNF